MNTKVMIVARNSDYGSDDVDHPPIGTVGEIVCGPDRDGDYYIYFPEYICPVEPPLWVIHKSMVVFIDPEKQNVKCKTIECL